MIKQTPKHVLELISKNFEIVAQKILSREHIEQVPSGTFAEVYNFMISRIHELLWNSCKEDLDDKYKDACFDYVLLRAVHAPPFNSIHYVRWLLLRPV